MVDAEIELVEHPGGGRAREQRQRLVDQVVVIEQRAAFLFVAIARNHFRRDGDECLGAVAGGQRAFAREQLADAILFGGEPREPVGMFVGDLLGDDIFARCKLGGAEDFEIIVDPLAVRRWPVRP